MTTNPTQLDALTADMLTELIDLQNQIEPLKARAAEIEKILKHLEPGKYTNGIFDVTVSPSTRFNAKKFTEAFPPENNPHLYQEQAPKPNTKMIPPAVKEQFSDVYDNRLTIK